MFDIMIALAICFSSLLAVAQQKTFCYPININYGYKPFPNFSERGRHRATADPIVVCYKEDYYLFFGQNNGDIGGVPTWVQLHATKASGFRQILAPPALYTPFKLNIMLTKICIH